MTVSILHARRALTMLAVAALGACGGGGGDSSNPPAAELLAISDANADAVARAGLASAGVGPVAAGLGTGMGATGAADPTVANASRRASTLAVKAAARVRPMAARTIDCAVSGSVTVDLTDANANDLLDLPGESLRITASQCNEGDGNVLNGSFTMALTAFTNGTNFSFTMAFANLAVQGSDGTAGLDGTLAVRFSGGNTLEISADSFALRAQQTGSSYSFSLSDFSTRVVDSGDALVQRVAGRLAGSGLSSYSVDVTTPVSVVQRYADDYPSSGTMRFVGASGSALKVDALSATQVRLSVDANGDGTYETVRTMLWSELDR
jgi:hypothetical protein